MTRPREKDDNGNFSLVERCSDSAAEDQLRHAKLVEILGAVPEFQDQLNAFLEHISPDPEDTKKVHDRIKKDVHDILSTVFPPFAIQGFGSTVSRLQINSSDFDMHVHFESRPGKARQCLVKAAKALSESELFNSVRDICTARIPIVKCIHAETGTNCDINFSFLSGVENSRLMQYFMSLDDKLRSAMLIIKYWGISRGIILKKGGFSKYSLVMMFIFYLQGRFSFPSVCTLQQGTTPSTPRVKWNMNFQPLSDLNVISAIKSISITDILIGFFEYYSNFKYDTNVISPYLGKVIEKSTFKNLELLTELFEAQSKLIKSIQRLDVKHRICVQDPLELDRNTCNVTTDNLTRFAIQCSVAAEILSGGRDNRFINLISPIEKPDGYLKVCLHMTTTCVENMRTNSEGESDDELTAAWFRNTLYYLDTVFWEIFKFDKQSEGHFYKNHSYTVTLSKHFWLNQNRNIGTMDDSLTNLHNGDSESPAPEFKFSILISCIENKIRKRSTLVEVEFIRIVGEEELFESFTRCMSKCLVFWFYEPRGNQNTVVEQSCG